MAMVLFIVRFMEQVWTLYVLGGGGGVDGGLGGSGVSGGLDGGCIIFRCVRVLNLQG